MLLKSSNLMKFLLSVLTVAVVHLYSAAQQNCPPFSTNVVQIAFDQNNCAGGQIDNVACKEVRLQHGYHFAAQAGKSMRTYINPYGGCDIDYTPPFGGGNPPVISQSYEVGATLGSFAVTPSGAATYNIPIPVPPGSAGMVPTLAIAYNSQGGNGLLGVAWNLTGLSSITRVGRTPYHDQSVSGIELSNNDRFAIDGNRMLIADNSGYGSDGKVYSTEMEGFSRITSFGTAGNGPAWFKVETKDGSILEYGKIDNSSDDALIEASGGSTTALTWLLKKVTDSRGNYMKFYYYENNGEHRPDYIEYTGNAAANLLPYNKVQFVYGARQDKQRVYVAGHQIEQNSLLTSIEMYAGGAKTHEYRFDYSLDMNSHLKEVTEFGKDGSRYNSTKFIWNTNNITPTSTQVVMGSPSDKIHVTDYNADGFDDLAFVSNNGTFRAIENNDGDGTFTIGLQQNYILAGGKISGYASYRPDFINADLNGDGFDDMAILSTDDDIQLFRCSFIKSTGSGLLEDVGNSFQRIFPNNNDAAYHHTFGDFDGDGATDVFIHFYRANRCFIYSFKIGGYIVNDQPLDIGDQDLRFHTVDFNGDGKHEILYTFDNKFNNNSCNNGDPFSAVLRFNGGVLVSSGCMGFPRSEQKIYTGDFNGDGKTDLLTWNSSTFWNVSWATGDGVGFISEAATGILNFGDPTSFSPDGWPSSSHRYFVRDLNGDGKADILDIGVGDHDNGPTHVAVHYSTGTVGPFNKSFITSATNYPQAHQLNLGDFLGDFDGDGRNEIYYAGKLPGTTLVYKTTFMQGADIHKVNTIVDGLGNEIHIDYNTLPILKTQSQYSKETGAQYPINDYQRPMTVAAGSHFSHDAFGNYNSVTYSYSGAKVHLQGKGFLGFTTFKSTNTGTGFVMEDTYRTDNTWLTGHFFQPVLERSKTTTTAGQNVSEKIFTNYTFRSGSGLPLLGDFFNKGYHFFASQWTENDQLHGNLTSFTMVQDNAGNITSQTSSNSAETRSTSNIYEVKGAWIKSKLTHTQTILTRTSTSEPAYTRFTSFENNGPGGLPSKKSEDTGLITQYLYNVFGLPETTQISGPNITQRSTLTEYDAQKRFAVKQTNPLSHVIENVYDPAYGNTLTAKDANGLITSYTYDGMGRLKETTSPIGTKVTKSRVWDVNAFPKTLYSVTATQTDGSYAKQYFDPLARELRSETKGFDGSIISTTKAYNNANQLVSESEPNSTALTSYAYEPDFKRIEHIAYPGGATTDYTYNGNIVTTTNTMAGIPRVEIKERDASGLLVSTTDADGNTLTNLFHSSGQPRQITSPGNAVSTMEYDAFGRRIKLNEPNAGITAYAYNELGQLTAQQTAKQFSANSTYSTITTYDLLGRVEKIQDQQEGDINYTYDGSNGKGFPATVSGYGVNYNYTYDNFSRVQNKTETVEGVNYTYGYTYDSQGRIDQETYPGDGGFAVKNSYNAFGYLSAINKVNGNTQIWRCDNMNERRQITGTTLGNGLTQANEYTNLGYLKKLQLKEGVNDIWNAEYDFNAQTSNLTSRKDLVRNLLETFSYDKLDRLTDIYVNGNPNPAFSTSYSASGNINNKSDVGNYGYDPGSKPHAVSQITGPSAEMLALGTQDITYNSFNQVATIGLATSDNATFDYGPDQQRVRMTVLDNGTEQYRRYYLGKYEKIIAGNTTRELHYIGSNVLYVRNTIGGAVTDSIYYIQTDHLGSIVLITDAGKAVVQERSYDAWGRQRNPSDWSYTGVQGFAVTHRGYTSHEHIYFPTMGIVGGELINMNGRLYDPILGRMLSPDNFVQGAGFTQSYNRYSYAANNPLRYTDPSGELIFVMPYISWSRGGGIDLGITVGIGVPGVASAQLSVGHGFSSNNTYVTLGGTLTGVTASVG
ncbi:MAG: hypothetical protein EPN85_11095, partial [Bacteroidetes bacterium]